MENVVKVDLTISRPDINVLSPIEALSLPAEQREALARQFRDPGHWHTITDPGHSHPIGLEAGAHTHGIPAAKPFPFPQLAPEPNPGEYPGDTPAEFDERRHCWTPHGDPTPRVEHYEPPRAIVSQEDFDKALARALAVALGIPARLLAGEPASEAEKPVPVDPEREARARNLCTVAALYNAPCLPR